jgi:hypothetical protein
MTLIFELLTRSHY